MQPRIFGPYEPIRRDYPIEEYLADAAAAGVGKSVYVQANWPADRFEEEAAWVQSVADTLGAPNAMVAYADFLADDIRPQLDRLIRYPCLRGVRMQLHWHDNPAYRFASTPDLARDARLRRNVARLSEYGLLFELQLFAGQMAGGAELVGEVPDVPFVLIHAGMMEAQDRPLSRSGGRAWRTSPRVQTATSSSQGSAPLPIASTTG